MPLTASTESSRAGAGSGAYKSARGAGGVPLVLASPTPQVPLPAQMAILLNGAQRDHDSTSSADHTYGDVSDSNTYGRSDNLRMPPAYAVLYPDVSEPLATYEDEDPCEEGFLSREKKHGCTMCHKRFDRPSTLKKHLLVHTGEKAFQCTICARRFGVMSNLNRHIRRCALREVHAHGSSAAAASAHALSNAASASGTTSQSAAEASSDGAESTPVAAGVKRKRRRRAPSPARWVPPSLRAFTLLAPELSAPAPVPLPPVSPARGGAYGAASSPGASSAGEDDALPWPEERDSWAEDENAGHAPYHPSEWAKTRPGRLPGPRPSVRFGGSWNVR